MILCIESWKGDTCLTGKKISVSELKRQIQDAQGLYDREEDNFLSLLCRMYGWEIFAASPDTVPDYTYDRDTGRVLRCVI